MFLCGNKYGSSVSSTEETNYLALAEQAEEAALRAQSRVARGFLQAMASDYRRRYAEKVRLNELQTSSKGDE
jgi:hypothetical protein